MASTDDDRDERYSERSIHLAARAGWKLALRARNDERWDVMCEWGSGHWNPAPSSEVRTAINLAAKEIAGC
jgi:hypothetical protein